MDPPVTGNFATDFSDLLGGVADLAWPVVVLVALLLFKGEIARLIQRVRRVQTPAGLVEIDRDLDRIQEATDRASESVPDEPVALPPARESPEVAPATPPEEKEAEDVAAGETVTPGGAVTGGRAPMGYVTQHGLIRTTWPEVQILSEAARSPRAALMTLSAMIERRSREVLASSQDPSAWRGTSLPQNLTRLDLSPSLQSVAREFQDVRNKIVHGHDASDEDALRAIDIGLELLSAIERLPHEVHYVVEPRVEVFADENGETPYAEFHGVLLESVSQTHAEKASYSRSIERPLPTTRDHFKKGKPVSWEWDNRRTYPEAWYRDPQDGEIKYGWTSSFEFVGRPLQDL